MRLFRWFKRTPPVVTVHVHIIDAAAIDAKQIAEKVRAELLHSQRRGHTAGIK